MELIVVPVNSFPPGYPPGLGMNPRASSVRRYAPEGSVGDGRSTFLPSPTAPWADTLPAEGRRDLDPSAIRTVEATCASACVSSPRSTPRPLDRYSVVPVPTVIETGRWR